MGTPTVPPPGVPLQEWPFGDRTRIVSVASGKGGVGKSSITGNLAASLAASGADVCVIDADVYGFSIPKILGVDEEPSIQNDKIRPPRAHGVKVVSMGFFVPEDRAVIWRGPMLHKALQQFVTDVEWGEPDFVLVDMPPGTGDVAISVSQFLPTSQVVVVTTPQVTAASVAQRMAAMAEKVGLRIAGIVENMSYFMTEDGKAYEIFGSGGGEALAEKLGVPLLGKIPLDIALREGADSGKPVVVYRPDAPSAVALKKIADALRGLPVSGRPTAAGSTSPAAFGLQVTGPSPAPPTPARTVGPPEAGGSGNVLRVTPKRRDVRS